MNTYEIMLGEQRELLKQLNELQEELSKLPEGKLLCAKNENRSKWYISDGKNKTYLSKKERVFAAQLAERKYIEYKIEDCNRKLYATTMFIRHYRPEISKSEALLQNEFYRELLDSRFTTWDEYVSNWANSKYEKSLEHPEHLIVRTKAKTMVRSKSESMIVSELYANKIPFHYEEKLDLENGLFYYPDFTIMHPRTGQIFYWEHFGKVDNPDYCSNMLKKLKIYAENEIYININLIVTTESKDHPIDPGMIQQTIDMFLK